MLGFRELAVKDMKLIVRRRLLLALLILYPFAFMGVIGLTYGAGRKASVGVVMGADDAGSKVWVDGEPLGARDIVDRYVGEAADVRYVKSEEEAVEGLRRGKLDAVLIMPDDLVERLRTLNQSAGVKAIVDETNPWMASASESALRGALSRINRAVVEEKLQAVNAGLQVLITGGDFFGNEVIGMQMVIRDLEEVRAALEDPFLREKLQNELSLARTIVEDLGEASDYLRATALPIELEVVGISGKALRLDSAALPLLLGLSTLWTGVLCAAVLLGMEEEWGMRRRLRMTAAKDMTVMAAKASVALLIVFGQSLVMMVVSMLVVHADPASIPASLMVICLTSLSSIGIGLLVAAFMRESAGAVIVSVMICLPLLFLSGAVFPLGQMPSYLRAISRLIPFTWAFEALGGVMMRSDPIMETLKRSGVLLGMGVLLLLLGSLAQKRAD
jgi:hypothetical protein